jgi:GTPase KRas protein
LLDILDTAGQEEYAAMREQYMRSGDGFILVYAINDRNSFQEMLTFVSQIQRVKDSDNVPLVLVGNKSDLEENRQVSIEEGQKQARLMGCEFVESSARTGSNVEAGYYMLVRRIRSSQIISVKPELKKTDKKKFRCLVM